MHWMARRSGRTLHADDARTEFEVDYARVVHSGSFRRLQGKTQILALGDDDFYRTRLTHSMEVAQVAEGVAQQLRHRGIMGGRDDLIPSAALISTIGLAHDLGHPPFGHGGEIALNYCMRDAGGFEGNAQTLRILARLEGYDAANGADLTRRAMLGILKYPVPRSAAVNADMVPSLLSGPTTLSVLDRKTSKPVKSYYDSEDDVVAWIVEPLGEEDVDRFRKVRHRTGEHAKSICKSFDSSIMDVADDIAYGVHDLEDAIALGLVSRERFCAAIGFEQCRTLLAALDTRPLESGGYDGFVDALFGEPGRRKRAIGRLVHHFLRAVGIGIDGAFEDPLLAYQAVLAEEERSLLDDLQRLVVTEVIDNPSVQHLEFKGQTMVVAVFEAMAGEPERLLPRATFADFDAAGGDVRIVCDYIAAMTDRALLKTYDRCFSPRMGSVFDRL
ncbi:anti-phage deoxyguanosine triphosphatase [Sphingomonas aurantiaca]